MNITKQINNNDNVSPGSLGGKIKRIRELRGLTQKELGIRCGFSSSTADVRIAQYEKNKKVPREKALKELAAALEIPEGVLDPNLVQRDHMYHVLFDIEDFHGLHPVEISGKYFLEFSGPTYWGQNVHSSDYSGFMHRWLEQYQKYAPTPEDSQEVQEEKARQYAAWRLEYPLNDAKEMSGHRAKLNKMHRLQAEMDITYAELMADEELTRLEEAVTEIVSEDGSAPEIKYESELIYHIQKMMIKGVPVERFCPIESIDYEFLHMISFPTEDLLSNKVHLALYAYFAEQIVVLKKKGYDIKKLITAKEKKLFVTFKYAASQSDYFDNISTYWDDMVFIAERKDAWPGFQLEPYETAFAEHITGENDVHY